MAAGGIGWVVVGSDRIAANGDVANKIGTYGLALAARAHGVKFMVAAPTSTIDMNCPVTPAHLVDAIVTEKGVIESPDARKLAEHMGVT